MDSKPFERICVGDVVVGEVGKPTREGIVDFCEASLDYNPLHLDNRFMEGSFGKTQFEGVIVHGMWSYALITRMMTDWLYPLGGIHRRLETRWLKPLYPGDVLTPRATVSQKIKTLKGQWVVFQVEVKNQKDEVTATGEAMAEFQV